MNDSQHACSDSNGGPSDSKREGVDTVEAADGTAEAERTEANREAVRTVTMQETSDFFRARPGVTIGGMIRLLLDAEAEVERLRAAHGNLDDTAAAHIDGPVRDRDEARARLQRYEAEGLASVVADRARKSERERDAALAENAELRAALAALVEATRCLHDAGCPTCGRYDNGHEVGCEIGAAQRLIGTSDPIPR